jgi:hypothetical protein
MVSVLPASVFSMKISITGIELQIKLYNIVHLFSPVYFLFRGPCAESPI